MYYDYPLEQLAQAARQEAQSIFARVTKDLAPDFKEVLLQPSAEGLRIFAANETALEEPDEVIRQMHAGEVRISEPRVRLFCDETGAYEPVMWVRAAMSQRYTEAAIHDLISRGAEIEEADWTTSSPTVRARAPLRALMGYAKALVAMTNSTADLRMWLSHYESSREIARKRARGRAGSVRA